MPKIGVIVVAAGSSQRFGTDKLSLNLAGKPVWRYSAEQFLSHPAVTSVVIVTSLPISIEGVQVVPGGATRQESVANGIAALPADTDYVLVHDAARPLISSDLINRVIAKLDKGLAVGPALAVTDTIRQEGNGVLDRSTLHAIQTPQGATYADFIRAQSAPGTYTDDLSALEAVGCAVRLVPGEPANMKLTTPQDWNMIQSFLTKETRTGLGYDIHAFSSDPNRPLWLGGVEFDSRPGLEGHSDADALLHAVVDAILGAACLGDIGLHYPNTDPRWHNAPSSLFLTETAQMVRDLGWKIVHVDATVLAERPKVLPKRLEICAKIAECLGIDADRISIKATTHERLGAIGREEGIAAMATATLERLVPA